METDNFPSLKSVLLENVSCYVTIRIIISTSPMLPLYLFKAIMLVNTGFERLSG